MSAGDQANLGYSSYLAVGREATFKTFVTCTANLDFISASLKTIQEQKVIEAVSCARTHTDRISLSKVVQGDIEFYFGADHDASNHLLQNAMGGGTVTSATAVGDTAGTSAWEHTLDLNNFTDTYSSLSINHRKGDTTNGKVFGYQGGRVNEMSFSAEIDEALKSNASMVFVDSSVGATDVEALLTCTGQNPLSFADMRLSVESTFASLTASAFWHVQSAEFSINNQLKSDSASRRIGSNLLDVLPAGIALFSFNFVMRFDTLTAYNAMLNETQLSAQLSYQGSTLTGSSLKEELRFDMPKIFISDAGDPAIGGPDEVLSANIVASVLRDSTSATGYAVKAIVRNETSSY